MRFCPLAQCWNERIYNFGSFYFPKHIVNLRCIGFLFWRKTAIFKDCKIEILLNLGRVNLTFRVSWVTKFEIVEKSIQ
jgi:hypothetical protein